MEPITILMFEAAGTPALALAEALLRSMAPAEVTVTSASMQPMPPSGPVQRFLSERGLPHPESAPRSLEDLGDRAFSLVIELVPASLGAAPQPPLLASGHPAWRPLMVGDPIQLRWPLRHATVDKTTRLDGPWLDRVFRELEPRVSALFHGGFLDSLLDEHDRAHRFLDALQDGVVAHDEYRCICLFNRAAEELTGLSRDRVLGRDCHEVFAPDGLCGSSCLFAAGPRELKDLVEYTTTFTSPAGEDRKLRMSVRPMQMGAGRFAGVLAVIRDVTEVSDLRWQVKQRSAPFHGTVGASAVMQDIFETIRQVAASDYPVLISGESGTGKELVARAIHAESRRADGPFVPINCGALPENILESELFGHVRGAFTGAIRDKKGRFELAHRGTLFLDEVGELSPAFQVKLLRVLQEKRFEMVGGERQVTVDVRIISATNRDLRQMVAQGQFREDLFYRLCVVPLTLPPLRERREDIVALVEHFMQGIRKETGKPIRRLSDEAMDALLAHPWPGNVRELINALQFAAVRCPGDQIEPAHLPPEVRKSASLEPQPRPLSSVISPREPAPVEQRDSRFKLDHAAVDRALAQAGGNKVRAAQLLGVGRATLYRFLGRKS